MIFALLIVSAQLAVPQATDPIVEWTSALPTVSAVLTGPSSVQCGAIMNFTYTLKNPSSDVRTFLVTDTPLAASMMVDAFQFSGSEPWEYTGIVAKKNIVIQKADMITIPAQGEVSKSIDLTQYYACKPGANMTVQAEHTLWEVLTSNHVSGLRISTNPKVFNCIGDPQPVDLYSPHNGAVKKYWRAHFTDAEGTRQTVHWATVGCTYDQVRKMVRPVENAFDMTMCEIDTREDVANIFRNYHRLPGKAVATFMKTHSLFKTGKFVVDCSMCARVLGRDAQHTYAFVYPSRTGEHRIHVCPVFWVSERGGILNSHVDTMGGTLIHEATHFNDVGHTDDICYGSRCRLSQAQALNNADSYEYVAERCRCPSNRCHALGEEIMEAEEVHEKSLISTSTYTAAMCLFGVISGMMVTVLRIYKLKHRGLVTQEPMLG